MLTKNLLSFSINSQPKSYLNIPNHLAFLKEIRKNWSGSPDQLINFIKDFEKNNQSEISVIKVFEELLIGKAEKFSWEQALENYKIITLRELFYTIYGIFIVFSPFSLEWIKSKKTIIHKNTGLRVNLYIDGDFHFAEYDFSGWLNSPNGFIFPLSDASHILADFSNPSIWIKAPNNELIIDSIKELYKDSCTPFDNSIKIVTFLENNENLGHFLWNKMSGVIFIKNLFKNTSREISVLVSNKSLQSEGLFSEMNIANICREMIESSSFVNDCKLQIVENPLDELDQFLSGAIFSKVHMIFMDESTRKIYCNFYDSKECTIKLKPIFYNSEKNTAKVNIFLNVRSHNKSHSNIESCIHATINKIPNELIDKIFFIIEGTSDATVIMDKVSIILRAHNISNIVVTDLNQYQLYFYIKNSNICITSVGSGLVFPTWLFNGKSCITYADHMHMDQLAWWASVVSHKLNISKFNLNEIIHLDNLSGYCGIFYANFDIDPEAFSNIVVANILDNFLTRP